MPGKKPRKGRSSPEYNWTPRITPQGGLGHFLVQSEADPGVEYAVDLEAYDGEGRCTCDDFATRVAPMRDRDVEPVHKNCKHIRTCFSYVGREFIRHIIKKAKRGLGSDLERRAYKEVFHEDQEMAETLQRPGRMPDGPPDLARRGHAAAQPVAPARPSNRPDHGRPAEPRPRPHSGPQRGDRGRHDHRRYTA